MRFLSILALTILPLTAQQFTLEQLAHQPLTNENIVTLAKAGFDELFIAQLIRRSRTDFDTSVPGMVALKQAGVSQDLIRFMTMPPTIPVGEPAVTSPPKEAPPPPPKKKRLFGIF
jgi:hypothetical protein